MECESCKNLIKIYSQWNCGKLIPIGGYCGKVGDSPIKTINLKFDVKVDNIEDIDLDSICNELKEKILKYKNIC